MPNSEHCHIETGYDNWTKKTHRFAGNKDQELFDFNLYNFSAKAKILFVNMFYTFETFDLHKFKGKRSDYEDAKKKINRAQVTLCPDIYHNN